jgi:tRNA(adenine34) deaminase
MQNYYKRIKHQYNNFRGDSTKLFKEILRASNEIGMDEALAYLEQCVIEKRLAWLEANLGKGQDEDDPIMEGYRWFYEEYLGLSIPKDGEMVEHTEKRMVMHWWNPCPTLEACQKLGLDTREICKKAYQQPVQEFLKNINPKLQFDRNYESIRPYTPYCEEIIELVD